MEACYQVCIPHTGRDFFDYEGNGLEPAIGSRVWVPLRQQTRVGIVIGKGEGSYSKLKSISALIDEGPLISEELLSLCFWLGSYYQSPLSEVLPLVLPKKYRVGQPTSLPLGDCYQLTVSKEEAKMAISSRAHKQLELIDCLSQQTEAVSRQYLTQKGFTSSHILALLSSQVIALSQKILLPYHPAQGCNKPLDLNAEQLSVVQTLIEQKDRFHCFVLQGVTGSGKTEVYLQVIAAVLAEGKQVLVLVPEIGLTPQLVSRFATRFNQAIAVLHSHLNETERQSAWQLAKENQVCLVIGTRSAVFTPMPELGLIVIDEEHDASFKQMEGVRYSARDTALMRAYQAGIPVILGSATPSLESLHHCRQKKYTLLRLNHKALSKTPLYYQLVDLRAQQLEQGLAATTLSTIEEHLNANNQVLVFINRRGFAPILLCHLCGWMIDCPACDSHLTVHKKNQLMLCHHCGFTREIINVCPSCKAKELVPVGLGTQRIHEFLSRRFPKTQALRVDRDEVRGKKALDLSLDRINSGQVQLIIGTQMLAKGHHFPRLSLVVILDADAGFYNQDFRALERLGQLLTQVSGRAGRAEHPGTVLIQTHVPDHPLLGTLIQQGYDAFAEILLASRQEAALPPYAYLALFRAQGVALERVLKFLTAVKVQLKKYPLALMGPAPAPMPRKAHLHRMQLLIKASSRAALRDALTQLREWLSQNAPPSGLRWNIDVDPMDLS